MTNRDYAREEFFRTEIVGGRKVLIGLDEGEIPNGARVMKVNSEPNDSHQDGVMATVVGAWEVNEMAKAELRRLGKRQIKWAYWVKFDDIPDIPVAIADFRIKRQEDIFVEGG